MSCKGCDVKEEALAVDVDELIAEQLSFEIHLADEELVKKRVGKCEMCPFRSLHTCTKCGCFYKFRANLVNKECPVGNW
ncbi:hypothetical protein [Jeotgalibaca ciconiae]|uniref:Uncharacterized protein n=1 Tax=Jeotgalibaca ciconiae TaxID=2496265 RepID=A0A3S9H8A5_9LACT|nr:hypothetical protein [Jeotgalibaca ciconiae]AZP03566.1 hypothetical protein EJN90_02145 [Jeotgalibaca ciconiae]